MPQNKRDKPGSLFSVDMACQAYSCLTWQGYGKSLFHFPDPVKKKEFYMTWLTNLNIEETSFTSTKHKLVCEDLFETSCFEGNLMVILFIFLIILNIWIYYTITFCRFTFCFYRYAYGKTNESGKKVRLWDTFTKALNAFKVYYTKLQGTSLT
jgi:hypothetical protein